MALVDTSDPVFQFAGADAADLAQPQMPAQMPAAPYYGSPFAPRTYGNPISGSPFYGMMPNSNWQQSQQMQAAQQAQAAQQLAAQGEAQGQARGGNVMPRMPRPPKAPGLPSNAIDRLQVRDAFAEGGTVDRWGLSAEDHHHIAVGHLMNELQRRDVAGADQVGDSRKLRYQRVRVFRFPPDALLKLGNGSFRAAGVALHHLFGVSGRGDPTIIKHAALEKLGRGDADVGYRILEKLVEHLRGHPKISLQ